MNNDAGKRNQPKWDDLREPWKPDAFDRTLGILKRLFNDEVASLRGKPTETLLPKASSYENDRRRQQIIMRLSCTQNWIR